MVDVNRIFDYTDCVELAEKVVVSLSEKDCRAMCVELLAMHYEDNPNDYISDVDDYK